MRVVVVEDDPALSLFLRKGLEMEHHTVCCCSDGRSALLVIGEQTPDLIVLDLNLPNMDGVDVLRSLRDLSEHIAVLVLTGRSAVEDRVACLDLGADDYLLKPFSFHEMLARCRALGRRKSSAAGSTVRHGDLLVDRVSRSVTRAGIPVNLATREFELLDYLLQNRGRAVSRLELLNTVWKNTPNKGTNVVDVYVNYLRRKLSTGVLSAEMIETVRGAGYTISPVPVSLGSFNLPSATAAYQWSAA